MKLSTYKNLRVMNFSVHALRSLLEEAGLDWRGALATAGLDPNAIERPGGTIPASKELAFQLQFVALTSDRPDLWTRASKAYSLGAFGLRGLALATAPTIEAYVVGSAVTDQAPGLIQITPLRCAEGVVCGIEFAYPDAPLELIPFSAYRDLYSTARTLTWLNGTHFPITRVEMPVAEVSPTVAQDLLTEVECGTLALRLWWNPALSRTELPFGDPFQHTAWVRADTQLLDTLREAGDWPATVTNAIKRSPDLNRKLANVAAELRVSPRTLQRKLEQSGREFADLRDEALGELASDLLSRTDHSIAQISRMLGYAEPASFTIAFKRWRGMPPVAHRNASRYERPSSVGARSARAVAPL
jgi:AraC-like DNA-binding protein